jgi:colanic acid/amylovoran biosynthesis glycosyltransferase
MARPTLLPPTRPRGVQVNEGITRSLPCFHKHDVGCGKGGSVDLRDQPVVAVWRSLWLPASETFVRDHVVNLSRWKPLTLGLYEEPSVIPVKVDRAPFHRTAVGVRLARVSRRLGHIGAYDGIIRRRRPALVHAHFGTGAVEVLPVARRHRLPLLVTFHGHDVNRAPYEDGADTYRRRLAEVFEYADVLLAVSDFLRDRLVQLGAPPEKVQVHYLGIPVLRPLPAQGPRAGIVFVGRLIQRKGVDDLISAYSRLPSELRCATSLTIVGDGPERGALERLAGSVSGGRITFAGYQPPDQVEALLASAALFVGPSKALPHGDEEALGLTFLEAARAGVPAVGYDFAGVPEAVLHGRTGLLARVNDVEHLGVQMERLLVDEELAHRLGRTGQQRVVAEFDVVQRTRALERLYDQVAERSLSASKGARA